MYVKTDYDGCGYITAEKVYKCFWDHDGDIWIDGDDNDQPICIQSNFRMTCLHLDSIGTWTICDKEGNEV